MIGFFRSSIHSRVMSTLKARVANAQKEHDEECARLDDAHEMQVFDLEVARESAKERHADDMVGKILGR